ncbi:PBSX family phage terminase large subunit [Companilactobacillus sp. DQM5]|uniref:PBSX family phage terminase large subunit n=1 Tax=Companilactobacillus sp. DQM5 TaxID=3463359 RepID=UPI004059D1B5
MQIDIQNEVQPHFKNVWLSKKPYNILKGGRNSFKSSVIALKLVYMMIAYIILGKKANVVIIRKVSNTIRDSVFLKIQWALNKFGIAHMFNMTVAPFKITHKLTGSTFYFYGQDDFQKLKSNDINDIIAVWYEEAAEFKNAEEFDQTNITFMRQKQSDAEMVQFFWSYNPPRNPYSWINEWTDSKLGDNNYLVDSSSYLDDELGFITNQILDEINRIKENDYDYYRYLYLGEAVGLGSNIYNMNLFHSIKQLPDDDSIGGLTYSIDAGHQTSATTCLCVGITQKGKVILIDTYYYSPAGREYKKSPQQLAKDIHKFIERTSLEYPNATIIKRTIDSAEGGLRNQYYNDFKIKLHGVNKAMKKETMIDYMQDLLAQGRVFILQKESNQIVISQHRQYRWDEKTIETDNPKVIKEEDHTCDAFQYMAIDNRRLLGLKR